jgi:hypothetical protein
MARKSDCRFCVSHWTLSSAASVSIPFSISQLAQSRSFAERLTDFGVTLSIDLSDPGFAEVILVKLEGLTIFQVWRSSAGFHLEFLFLDDGTGLQGVPSMAFIWATMIYLMDLPHEALDQTDNRDVALDCLPAWLRDSSPAAQPFCKLVWASSSSTGWNCPLSGYTSHGARERHLANVIPRKSWFPKAPTISQVVSLNSTGYTAFAASERSGIPREWCPCCSRLKRQTAHPLP